MDPEIGIWRARLDLEPRRLAELRSYLTPAERAREARFARPAGRACFAAARGQLREVLAARLGMDPGAVPIIAGAHGKPCLDPGAGLDDVRFNLSHSGALGLVALAEGREIGVDVERDDARRRLERVAARFMSPREIDAWRAIPGAEERVTAFVATWTRKEAYAKGIGEGLGVRLAEHELVAFGEAGWWALRAGGRAVAGWLIADIDVQPGYAAALAVQCDAGRLPAIRVRSW